MVEITAGSDSAIQSETEDRFKKVYQDFYQLREAAAARNAQPEESDIATEERQRWPHRLPAIKLLGRFTRRSAQASVTAEEIVVEPAEPETTSTQDYQAVNESDIRLGRLASLKMNTIDRAVLGAMDKLSRLRQASLDAVRLFDRNETGERRLRTRAKVALGAVALTGVTILSDRLGLFHETHTLFNDALSQTQGIFGAAHEHSQTAKSASHDVATHAVNHTQTTAEHAKSVTHPSVKHSQSPVAKHKTAEVYSFNAPEGDSITHEFQSYAAEHGRHINAHTAFNWYQSIREKIGNHKLASHQYIMPDGNVGLLKGHNSLSPETIDLLKKYTGQ